MGPHIIHFPTLLERNRRKSQIGCVALNAPALLINTHHCINVIVFDSSHYLFLLRKLEEWWISFPSPALFQLIGTILTEALTSAQRRRLHLLCGVQVWDHTWRECWEIEAITGRGKGDEMPWGLVNRITKIPPTRKRLTERRTHYCTWQEFSLFLLLSV